MPWQVRLQTHQAHRQGDSSLQPKSRLVGRAFVVCAFSDISRPEHSQETPSQKIDQSVTQMIPDEERAVSVLRRHRAQSGNEERVLLPMSDTWPWNKKLSIQKVFKRKRKSSTNQGQTAHFSYGGKDFPRSWKDCIQTVVDKDGYQTEGGFSRSVVLGYGIAITNSMKCHLTLSLQKNAISKEKAKVTCFPSWLCSWLLCHSRSQLSREQLSTLHSSMIYRTLEITLWLFGFTQRKIRLAVLNIIQQEVLPVYNQF